ncbi:FUSC family protein [Arthrobacter globiformis]|uniref:FUSC family protein n=2 Tax=Arthrobacter TaxID=1663 RepID=A0AAU8ESQ5_9MICC|nr:FUSC family protein [Arthrobacter globiformis]
MSSSEQHQTASRDPLPRRIWQSVATRMARALAAPRLQLAAKAGLAAGIAFWVAPLMPGGAAQYAYYAPLGALVAMYENVSGSMRQGFQTLVGLGAGIGLAFLLISFGATPLTVAAVMALGVLLAGLPRLGAGRDWIPTAALLVLLVGGQNPDDFSFGYLLQMGVGVVVGIAVNLLVFPPLHFNAAALSLAELRLSLARQLSDMGAAMHEKWPPEHEDWSRRSEDLAQSARSVRAAVQKADASRAKNPRRRFHPRDVDKDYRNVRDLEHITFHIQDMTEVLADVIWSEDMPFTIPLPYSEPLAEALSAVGEVLRAAEEDDVDRQAELFRAAEEAVASLEDRTAAEGDGGGTPSAAGSILLSLHRILRVAKPNGK